MARGLCYHQVRGDSVLFCLSYGINLETYVIYEIHSHRPGWMHPYWEGHIVSVKQFRIIVQY